MFYQTLVLHVCLDYEAKSSWSERMFIERYVLVDLHRHLSFVPYQYDIRFLLLSSRLFLHGVLPFYPQKCLILLRLLPDSPHICLPSSHFANNIWPKGTQRWRHTSYSEPGKYQKEYWHTGVKGWSSLNNKVMESCWLVKRPLSASVYYMWLTLFVIQILWYHAVFKCISVLWTTQLK